MTDQNTVPPDAPASVLSQLGLSPSALQALSRQGYVVLESRGTRRPIFKLRFRIQGRQHVKYLGQDPAVAEQVRRELQRLQRARRQDLELGRLTREARRVMRETKRALEAQVQSLGLSFHGLAIRDRSAP